MPLLSIIVPVFNTEKYIDACIKSILKQSFTDFELILIDDGSNDSSGLKCEYYEQLDTRVKVIHQENRGVSSARNVGLSISIGQYIGFVDSDDTLEIDMYNTLIKNIIDSGSDISICGIKKTYKKSTTLVIGETNIEYFAKEQAISPYLKGKFWYNVGNKIFKSNIAKNIKFEGRINEDIFYNFLAICQSTKLVFQNVCNYNYILRENSVSLEKFSNKNLESLLVSQKIMAIVSKEMPSHLIEAQVNDFVENISILNQIILSKKSSYPKEYKMVIANLKEYSFLLKENRFIRKKHLYAYYIFQMSPFAYSVLLQLYFLFIPSETSERGKKT